METQCLPLSVIIPAYNAERYIGEALESVLAQTAPPAEIIVVDNGSNDRTVAVAKAFGVRVLQQAQRGPSATRNAGILAATKPWVAFLDADDIWEPEKLKRQWIAIEGDADIGAVFSDFVEFDETGPRPHSFLTGVRHYQKVSRSELAPGVFLLENSSLQIQFNEGNFIRTSTLVVRRDLLLQVGLFDTSISHCEDRDVCLRLLPKTNVAVIERPLVRYRLTVESLSSDSYKMAVGAARVADRILARPQEYSSSAIHYYEGQRPTYYLNVARFAEERGDIKEAREYYLRSWRLGGGVRALALAIVSRLPTRMRSLTKETVRRIRGDAQNRPYEDH
jgi:glycosyltransferase involved in cell wall biosynthesis